MSERTKGPWRWLNSNTLVGDHGRRPVVLTCRKNVLMQRGDDGLLHALDCDDPNARLIAASPVMLDALESAERYLDECGPLLGEEDPESGVHEMLAIVRAAIASARGTP